MAEFIEIEGESLKLKIQARPGSSRTGWGKPVGRERLKLMVSAPPVNGKANKACVKFIAKQFGTSKSSVSIVQGEKSRRKTFLVKNFNPDKLKEFLDSLSDYPP